MVLLTAAPGCRVLVNLLYIVWTCSFDWSIKCCKAGMCQQCFVLCVVLKFDLAAVLWGHIMTTGAGPGARAAPEATQGICQVLVITFDSTAWYTRLDKTTVPQLSD